MLLISPNFDVKLIVFFQFWPGAQNCRKKPCCMKYGNLQQTTFSNFVAPLRNQIDDSHEISKLNLSEKKKFQNLSSVAVMTGHLTLNAPVAEIVVYLNV